LDKSREDNRELLENNMELESLMQELKLEASGTDLKLKTVSAELSSVGLELEDLK
jgi:hypothetical protein